MANHELRLSRYKRGQQTYGNIRGVAGMTYDTRGECSCGNWSERRNVAPSRGGEREIKEAHKQHINQSTDEGTQDT